MERMTFRKDLIEIKHHPFVLTAEDFFFLRNYTNLDLLNKSTGLKLTHNPAILCMFDTITPERTTDK